MDERSSHFYLDPGEAFLVKVMHADNNLAVIVNDQLVYNKHTDLDPVLSDTVDVAASCHPGENSVNIVFANGYNPAHVKYQLFKGANPAEAIVDERPPGEYVISYHRGFLITKR